MQVTSHQFNSIADAKAFTLAGNATLTLQSNKTGAHFTYKVRQAKGDDEAPQALWFVSLLSGPDNGNDYQYLGIIRNGRFTRTAKSRVGEDAPSFKAFAWFWNVQHNGDNGQLSVFHLCKCGRCGRALTTPESITIGLGPECLGKVGGAE